MSKNKKIVIVLLIVALLIAVIPVFARKGAEFGGSDDAGSRAQNPVQNHKRQLRQVQPLRA